MGILLISGITGILTEVITHPEVINKRIVIGGNNSSVDATVDATPQSQQFYFPGW